MKKLVIIAALVIMFGCSSASDVKPTVASIQSPPSPEVSRENKGNKDEVNLPSLKAINVSLYSTKHPEKAQPMLINVISEPNEMKGFDSKLQKNKATELPASEVTDVYYLQLEYVTNGVSNYKDIVYVGSSGDKSYFKEFKMSPDYNFETFDEKTKEKLVQAIGTNDWYPLSIRLPI